MHPILYTVLRLAAVLGLLSCLRSLRNRRRLNSDSEMMSISTTDVNPQSASPLYNRIPGEVRTLIFSFALTEYYDKSKPYDKDAYYYRPGYRYHRTICSNVLQTCRLVYHEAHFLAPLLNEHVEWHDRAPPAVPRSGPRRAPGRGRKLAGQSLGLRHPSMVTVHFFTQQTWLESRLAWRSHYLNRHFDVTYNIKTLKITIRHSDWWWWESQEPLKLDPKQQDTASETHHSKPEDEFHPGAWGQGLKRISGLKNFELELETVEHKRPELDKIVSRAPGWRFPLEEGKEMVLDESKTRKTGWIGRKMRKYTTNTTPGQG